MCVSFSALSQEKSFQWWPRDVDVPVSVGPLQVTLVSEEEMGDGLVRWTLTVSGEKVRGERVALIYLPYSGNFRIFRIVEHHTKISLQ